MTDSLQMAAVPTNITSVSSHHDIMNATNLFCVFWGIPCLLDVPTDVYSSWMYLELMSYWSQMNCEAEQQPLNAHPEAQRAVFSDESETKQVPRQTVLPTQCPYLIMWMILLDIMRHKHTSRQEHMSHVYLPWIKRTNHKHIPQSKEASVSVTQQHSHAIFGKVQKIEKISK